MFGKRIIYLGLAISVFTSFARAEEVPFAVHLQVNEKIENFINILTSGLLPVFTEAKVSLRRDARGQVIDEFGHGKINADFYGVVDAQDGGTESEFVMQTSLAIKPSSELENQYKIAIHVSGEVMNSKNYLLAVKNHESCISNQEPSVICQIARGIDFSGDFHSALHIAIENVKLDLLRKISGIDDRKRDEFPLIREEFLEYLNTRISLTKTEDGVRLQINLADLANRFRGKAGQWLNDNNLIDYSVEQVDLQFVGESLVVEVQLAKYHVISSFNAIMQAAASYQNSFEDPEVAKNTVREVSGKSLGSLKNSLTSNAHLLESYNAGVAYGSAKILGSKNTGVKAPSQTEQDLGLE